MNKTYSLILLIILLSGCTGLQKANGWYGATEAGVIAQRGYPEEKRNVAENVNIMVYPSAPGYKEFFTVKDGAVIKHDVRYQGGLF